MHDEDGGIELTLKRAQVSEDRGDRAGVVLVDAMNADEGIENDEARGVAPDGIAKACLIAPAIETKRRGGDDVDRSGGEIELSRAADAGEACLHGGGRVLSHVEENGPRIVDLERAKAARAGRDRDGEVEREP